MRKSQKPRMFCLRLQQGHHRLSKLFSVQGCSADGGEGKGLEAGGLNPACTPLAKPCAQCKIMSVQGGAPFCHSAKALYMLAGSPQQGKIALCLQIHHLPKAHGKSRWQKSRREGWVVGGYEEKLPSETIWVSRGAYNPMPPSWLPKQHSSEKSPVTDGSLLLPILHYPSLGLSSAFPGLPACAKVRYRFSEQLCFSLSTPVLHTHV